MSCRTSSMRSSRTAVRRRTRPRSSTTAHCPRRRRRSDRSATAERLSKSGLKVDLVPQQYRAEAVAQALAASADVRGLRVFLPRADVGRDTVAAELRKKGAEVTEAIAYRTIVADTEREGEPDIYRMLLERSIDVVTFTSGSAVRSFVKVLGAEPAADLLRTTAVASIGPVTAEVAAQH